MKDREGKGLSSSAKGMLFVFGAQLLFSMSVLVTKVTVENVSPLTLLSWRFTFAALGLTVLAAFGVVRVHLNRKMMKVLLPMALFQPVLYFIGETAGIQLTTASESGTILACVPIATLLFSALFLKKIPTWKQSIGIIVSVLGVIIMVLVKGAEASLQPLGYAALLLAVCSAAAFTILSDRITQYTSIDKTYNMALLGAIVFNCFAMAEHGAAGTLKLWITLPFTNAGFLWTAAYLGVGCSVAAFFCMNKAIHHIGAMRTSSFAGVNTVVTVLSGAVFLHEQLGLLQIVGTAMVMIGVYVTNAAGSGRKQNQEVEIDGTETVQNEE